MKSQQNDSFSFAVAALKLKEGGRYIINGHSALGFSNDYEGAGTVFKYYHPQSTDSNSPKQSILAKGPTHEGVDIMVGQNCDLEFVLCP